MKVYTIGYAGMNISEFIKVLKDHGVTTVVDVRRFPKSKDPAFTRENLENNLRDNGIKYVFLGESLGGFVRGGYEKYMETSRFREGFDMLLNLARKEVIAVMCKEKNVKYCHRRFISNLLSSLGLEVLHL
ncbi:MAG: DUF488 domain-containing protein [Candidatus Bathyarchaeia archaeon]|nr:DUF488 domain-containing protein [Candidatus Bathyarchaeota archaeon]